MTWFEESNLGMTERFTARSGMGWWLSDPLTHMRTNKAFAAKDIRDPSCGIRLVRDEQPKKPKP